MPAKELSVEIVADIQRILKLDSGTTGLDALNGFDPVETLNSLFPNEEALGNLAEVQVDLARQQAELQEMISMYRAELQRDQDPGRMQLVQELISELLSQMNRIREKATESEAIVQSITKEIQVLDLAKRNLTSSITTLRRLQMLANAVSQLEEIAGSKRYSQIARTLAATKEIFVSIKAFALVPTVAVVVQRMQVVQGRIRAELDHDFDTFFLQNSEKQIDPGLISHACLVVDVLGVDVRLHFIDRYCSIELKEYRKIFRASDEAGQLDNIARRFSWFKKLLSGHDTDVAIVFPKSWQVGQHLVARFADITKDDVSAALSKAAPTLTVASLLEALQLTLDFESSISSKYGVLFSDIAKLSPSTSKGTSISSVFEPHMNVFVDAQNKALADMLASSRGAKSRSSLEGAVTSGSEENPILVLPSSTELFYFYGQNLEQCAKLSNRKPLSDLCDLHKKWLKVYAEDVLFSSLKSTPKSERERKSMEGRFTELNNACVVLNTADYCQVTAVELEDKIKEKISDEYREQISLQPERDLFVSVISSAIIAMLKEVENAVEPGLAMMLRTQWGALTTVSGESPYVANMVRAVDTVISSVRTRVEQKKYLRNFYDKAANLLITKFTNSLVKSRPLKEIGAEQVLIDLQALKACLLRFPQGMEASALSATYAKTVTKSTTRLETLLKVINSPIDPPEGFVSNYTLLVGDNSFSNFQKVLDLKGTPRTEQNALLDKFLTMTSTMADLESASFLTSLDMDPPAIPLTSSSLVTPNASVLSLPGLIPSAAAASVGLMTPPMGSSSSGGGMEASPVGKREMFSGMRKLVNFATRRDREGSTNP
ncbi:Vacuolar protein sorting-associated protein 53 [Tulasnella sp. JGI-2019a]|nr:Vacuolar protein sorting-associated protein 53 [Tulasnella sp. JGI-2019a]KAG9031786.1 Vacuolar protein sorting-associated protein 53 [Tulasnella sp. JGI-2019a]